MLANGITLGYKKTGQSGSYTILKTLKTVPDLGSDPELVENSPIDCNTLQYDLGVGDAGDMEYTFKYEDNKSNSETRKILEMCDAGKDVDWEETLPDGTKFQFTGKPAAKISGGKLNDPLELKIKIGLSSDMKRVDPIGV